MSGARPVGRQPGEEGSALDRARADLAAQQAELLGALVAEGVEPAGFPAERLRIQSEALRAKRLRAVSRHCEELERQLGEEFGPLFEQYCRDHPPRAGTTARDDASRFRDWLVQRGLLGGPKRRFLRRAKAFLRLPGTPKST